MTRDSKEVPVMRQFPLRCLTFVLGTYALLGCSYATIHRQESIDGAAFAAAGQACQPTVFDGQKLALQ